MKHLYFVQLLGYSNYIVANSAIEASNIMKEHVEAMRSKDLRLAKPEVADKGSIQSNGIVVYCIKD